ncbi:Gfo/Idh/MocA family protein [Aggregatilinea lenta]|uniref:Gfo/Idh/MocA family protein n=1 Tax=Aggregatilinea lenta TaxID=913108 RepID=UPI000E5BD5F5|nr:Gfo/Idh/MocA family oxidoreductase [Aggregatilinea lenta]
MTAINVALIGCGGFVYHTHLANLIANDNFRIHAAVDVNLDAAQDVAQRGGAAYWTADADRALNDPDVELVFIATPHHTHADLSIRAARAGKHIYCEKPMALDEAGCQAVIEAVNAAGVKYMAGYNRAVAPFTLEARALLAELDAPMMIYHRFADWNPYGHGWPLDEALSGGRLVGEGGHALDSICRLTGQDPVRVYAEGGNFAEPSVTQAPDSALITLGFPDGSTGVLYLSSIANNGFPKEEIQITCANHTIVIYGYERMVIYAPDGVRERTLPEADKGLAHLLDMMVRVIREDAPAPVGLDDALRTSRCTFAAVRAIRTRSLQHL